MQAAEVSDNVEVLLGYSRNYFYVMTIICLFPQCFPQKEEEKGHILLHFPFQATLCSKQQESSFLLASFRNLL